MSQPPLEQQWEPVVLKKKTSTKPKTAQGVARAMADGSMASQRKHSGKGAPKNARKLDEETEDFKHVRVSHSFKVALMKARQAKGLTQAQLAQKLAVKTSVINEYESGKAIPDGRLISKLNRVLQTTLPKIPKKKKVTD